MELEVAALVFVVVLGAAVYAISRGAATAGDRLLMRRMARPSAGENVEILQAPGRMIGPRLPLGWLYRLRLTAKLEESLWQAGIYARVPDVLLIMLLMFGAGAAVGAAFSQDPLMSLAAGAACAVLPMIYVRVRRRRRLAMFSRQLPFALDLIRSSLRAGHSLSRGLQAVVAEFQDPIATEFRSAVEQSRLGLPLPRAIEEMLRRVPDDDLRLLVVAVRVQSEVGSSLAEVIERLTDIVRTRQRLQAQIYALTAQARLSGWVVGLLPVAVLAIFSLIQPSYAQFLFYDPMGVKLLEVTLFLDLLALVTIRQLLKLKF